MLFFKYYVGHDQLATCNKKYNNFHLSESRSFLSEVDNQKDIEQFDISEFTVKRIKLLSKPKRS